MFQFFVLTALLIVANGQSSCDSYTAQKSCLTAAEATESCAWCTSAAAGKGCYKESDAQGLPSSIFSCQYQTLNADNSTDSLDLTTKKLNFNISSTSGGSYGIDYSTLLSASTHQCFTDTYSTKFVVPRGFRSSGQVDTNVCSNLKNAQAGGILIRDVYMFPCPTCSASAASQVSTLVNYLNANCKSAWSGRIWLDIEGSQYWTTSYTTNQNWYKSLVDATVNINVMTGVYTSKSQWGAIFGSYTWVYNPKSYALWYAHYDNIDNFSDFVAFGGWTTPLAKQFLGTTTLCGAGVDVSWTNIVL